MYMYVEYRDGPVTHAEFYRDVNKDAGIGGFNDAFIDRVVAALAKGDEHLNTIPLAEWDGMTRWPNPHLVSALARRGTFYSLSAHVCALKTAAKDQAAARN